MKSEFCYVIDFEYRKGNTNKIKQLLSSKRKKCWQLFKLYYLSCVYFLQEKSRISIYTINPIVLCFVFLCSPNTSPKKHSS